MLYSFSIRIDWSYSRYDILIHYEVIDIWKNVLSWTQYKSVMILRQVDLTQYCLFTEQKNNFEFYVKLS